MAKPSRLRLLRQLKSRSKSGPIASRCPYSLTASVSFQSGMVLKVKIRTEAINRLKRAVRNPIQEMRWNFGDLGIRQAKCSGKRVQPQVVLRARNQTGFTFDLSESVCLMKVTVLADAPQFFQPIENPTP